MGVDGQGANSWIRRGYRGPLPVYSGEGLAPNVALLDKKDRLIWVVVKSVFSPGISMGAT